jgi:hypothetical protein
VDAGPLTCGQPADQPPSPQVTAKCEDLTTSQGIRRLHTPGGFYLLLCRLTESRRAFSGSATVWSVWRNGRRAGTAGTAAEHWDPFSATLRTELGLCDWAGRHDLRGDDGRRLKLDMNRLRTSVEVRRTRQMGGHLPSAARTNTMQTLWSSYLCGDPAVTEWAEDVLDRLSPTLSARRWRHTAGRSPPTRARSASSRDRRGHSAADRTERGAGGLPADVITGPHRHGPGLVHGCPPIASQ